MSLQNNYPNNSITSKSIESSSSFHPNEVEPNPFSQTSTTQENNLCTDNWDGRSDERIDKYPINSDLQIVSAETSSEISLQSNKVDTETPYKKMDFSQKENYNTIDSFKNCIVKSFDFADRLATKAVTKTEKIISPTASVFKSLGNFLQKVEGSTKFANRFMNSIF